MPHVPGILFNRRVLVVHNGMDDVTAAGRATAALVQDLRDRDIDVVDAASLGEAEAQIHPRIVAGGDARLGAGRSAGS